MDKLKNLPPQQKLLIGIGILGVIAGLFYYLVIMDLDDQIGQQTNIYNSAKKELAQFEDFKGEVEIAQLREQYALVIKKIEENKKIIPEKDNIPQLMSGLESDALESGLTVMAKDQRPIEQQDYYFAIPIRFEIKGSYPQLIRFLLLISEPGKRLVAPKALDIKLGKPEKLSKKAQAAGASPFGGAGKVVAPESLLTANLVIEGYTYTGVAYAGKKKK